MTWGGTWCSQHVVCNQRCEITSEDFNIQIIKQHFDVVNWGSKNYKRSWNKVKYLVLAETREKKFRLIFTIYNEQVWYFTSYGTQVQEKKEEIYKYKKITKLEFHYLNTHYHKRDETKKFYSIPKYLGINKRYKWIHALATLNTCTHSMTS